jgi:3-oxoacyl-ACP reductase-like protein
MYSTSTNSSAPSPTQPPVPAPAATAAPAPASITQTVYFLPVLFIIVAVVLGVVAVQVLFREKELRKELNSEGE